MMETLFRCLHYYYNFKLLLVMELLTSIDLSMQRIGKRMEYLWGIARTHVDIVIVNVAEKKDDNNVIMRPWQ